jgi:hypothetical protein
MSQPTSCCYYFPTPSPELAFLGVFQADEYYTNVDRAKVAAAFTEADGVPGGVSNLALAVNQLCSSNLQDKTIFQTNYLPTLVSSLITDGAFTNRDGSPIDFIYAAVSYGDWECPVATVPTDINEPVGAVAYEELYNVRDPITSAPTDVIWLKIPIRAGCKLAIHITASATRNPDFVPCQPSPPNPPDDCTVLCDDDEEDDDCEDDECVNVYARKAPRHFFGGVYRFA